MSAADAGARAGGWSPATMMLVGAAVISTNSILVRFAEVSPSAAGFWRMSFGGLMLLAWLAWRRRLSLPSFAEIAGWCVPAAAFAADLWLWHRSIRDVGPGLATLLANFQVFLMALVGVLAFGERIRWRLGLGLALAGAGLWLLVGREWSALPAVARGGVVFGLLTGVAYASYLLSLRWLRRRPGGADSERVLCGSTLICALMLAPLVPLEGGSFAIPDARSASALVALGFTGQVAGWILITRAMPHLPASLVGLLLLLQPTLSFLLDVAIFARPTAPLEWVGVALALAGIFVASAREAAAPVTSR